MPALVVLGARNLGGAIIDRFQATGWKAAGVARSADTVAAIRDRGALGIEADAVDPRELARALAKARASLGDIDLIVNAMSVAAPVAGEPWGGGPIAEATVETWERWSGSISHMALVFLSEGARALRAGGHGGTLIQITNGHALRTTPGTGPIAAGHHALRALTHTAAQELRGEGIRVCLLVADGPIWSPKNAERIVANGLHQAAVLDQVALAEAIEELATQPAGASANELVVTAPGQAWIPRP